MSTVTLNSRLNGQSTGGKFIYLGFISWVNAANTTSPNHPSQRNIAPNGNSNNCFGMSTEVANIANADSTPGVLEYIANSTNNPYNIDPNTAPVGVQGISLSYSTSVDFTGKTPGYYGFMYLVGDTNNDGVLSGECGDVECFEIEVVQEFPNYSPLVLSYCQDDAPSMLELFTLLNAENMGTLVNGGSWGTSTPIPTSTLSSATGTVTTIPVSPTPGTYTYTYTLSAAQMGAYHNILPGTCTSTTANVTINITADLSAGTGSSVAICNS